VDGRLQETEFVAVQLGRDAEREGGDRVGVAELELRDDREVQPVADVEQDAPCSPWP
jgi:hypothetical protein